MRKRCSDADMICPKEKCSANLAKTSLIIKILRTPTVHQYYCAECNKNYYIVDPYTDWPVYLPDNVDPFTYFTHQFK